MIKIVLFTLMIYWLLGCFLVLFVDLVFHKYQEEAALAWAVGPVFPIIWVLTYPIRAWRSYSSKKDYYLFHNITRWQYLLGRRHLAGAMNPIARKIWKGVEIDE